MNPILYPVGETAFDTNGIGILGDAILVDVIEQLNGQYELEMQYPVTGLHFSSIAMDCILMAKPDPVTDPQPFRIYHITKPMNSIITVYARHIAYDLMGITVAPFTSQSCAAALQDLKNNATTACPFDFWTDKSTAATMTVSVPKSIWAQLGGSSGSVLDVYGGEYEFDRYTVKLHNRRGADRGVSIRYGKNLTSLEQDENCANVFTGVHPYWTSLEGALIQLPEKILHAEGNFSKTKIKPLDLSMEFKTQPTEEQLRARAKKYMKDNDIGTPAVSWKVEFVQLEQTEEYKGKAILERVLLGDTVSVEFAEIGVSASARAVSTRYDSLRERYKNISLGKVKANIADTVVHQGQSISSKPSASTVQSMIVSLTASILGARGGAVRLLDTDGDGLQDTLYIGDNPDPEQAKKVWRFNYEGWAASKNGYNGPFEMGATLEGGLLAASVTAANLVAGTIQSKDGKTFFLDLDNGILKMQATELSISGKTVDTIAQEKVDAQTQTDIFNKLFDNGAVQGFSIIDGKLYINGAYAVLQNIVAKVLQSVSGNNTLLADGAKLLLQTGDAWNVQLFNGFDGQPILYMRNTVDGENQDLCELSPLHLKLGGTSLLPVIYFSADSGKAKLWLNGELNGKTLEWKDNGNGTFTLIGK